MGLCEEPKLRGPALGSQVDALAGWQGESGRLLSSRPMTGKVRGSRASCPEAQVTGVV